MRQGYLRRTPGLPLHRVVQYQLRFTNAARIKIVILPQALGLTILLANNCLHTPLPVRYVTLVYVCSVCILQGVMY
jgi:hypothetical protein